MSAVLEQKYQSVVLLGSNSRYFIVKCLCVKGIQPQHLCRNFFQRPLRYLLGWAGRFAIDIVGPANPNRAGAGHLSAVALAAGATDDYRSEWILGGATFCSIMFGRPPSHLRLYRLIILHADDGLVGVLGMVHRQFTTVGGASFW